MKYLSLALAISAALLAISANAASPAVASVAGKTCRGEYSQPGAHYESSMGALLFQPDSGGKAKLFMWFGREGKEKHKLAPQSEYLNMGDIQLRPTSNGMRFIQPISKKLYEFTSTGAVPFKFTLHQNDGSTSEGVLECQ